MTTLKIGSDYLKNSAQPEREFQGNAKSFDSDHNSKAKLSIYRQSSIGLLQCGSQILNDLALSSTECGLPLPDK